jgi:hypothetical protein
MRRSMLRLIVLVVLVVARVSCAFAQGRVGSTAVIANVNRIGIVLGYWSYWGSSTFFQNILMNPGFEPGLSGRVIDAASATSKTFCDRVNSYPMPAGFYVGATFQDRQLDYATLATTIVGTGTITGYNPTGCSGTPQFSYSAGFAVADNDSIALNGSGPLPGISGGGPMPGWWWPGDNAYSADQFDANPNEDGIQDLQISFTGSNGAAPAAIHQYGDALTQGTNFVSVAGPWQFSIWAKQAGATTPTCHVTFARGGTTYLNYTFSPTTSWTKYTSNFTGTDTNSTPVGGLATTFSCSAGAAAGLVRVDDVFLGPISSSGVWQNGVVSTLKAMNVGVIRDWQFDQGDSFDNKVADQWKRQMVTANTAGSTNMIYSIPDLFDLCSRVGAIPFVVIPTNMTEAEYTKLGTELASLEATYHFAHVLIEFGDENWNGASFQGDGFTQGGSFHQELAITLANHVFGVIQAAAGGTFLQFIGGSQYSPGNVDYVGQLFARAPGTVKPTYIDGAPYYDWCQNSGDSLETQIANLFNTGGQSTMDSIMATLGGLNPKFKLAFYEGGPSTLGGTDTTAGRLATIAGAASGGAEATVDLNAINAGVPVNTPFQFGQVNIGAENGYFGCGNPPSGTTVPLWGTVYNFNNGDLRPRALAISLLNKYAVCGDAYPIAGLPGGVAGAAFLCSDGWHLALANSNASDTAVSVAFRDGGDPLPDGITEALNFAAATDTNENNTTGVVIGDGPNATRSNLTTSVTVPPYDVVVVLPNGIAPTPAPSSTPITATPTPTPSPTPRPTATPGATATPKETPSPTLSRSPTPTPSPAPAARPTPTLTPSFLQFLHQLEGY